MNRVIPHFLIIISIIIYLISPSYAQGKDPLSVVTTSEIAFGIDVFKTVAKLSNSDNILISPASLIKGLGALHLGSRIDVTSALESILHIEQIPPIQFYTGMTALQESLYRCDPHLNLNASIWIQDGTAIRPEWKANAKEYYGTDMLSTNFKTKQGTQILNRWITQTVAQALAEPASIPQKNNLLMVDACTLRGTWASAFDNDQTTTRKFLTRNNTVVPLPMMQKTDQISYLKGNGFQAVSLPLSGQRLAVYLFLPDQSLNTFFTRLNPYSWSRWMLLFKPKMGTVCLPKLDINYSANMEQPLKQLGLGIGFSDRANFGGIGDNLKLVGATSHLQLKWDESGNQTSTKVQIVDFPSTPPFLLVFNRPFFFAIRDTLTGAIIMMGSVGNPQKSSSKS